MDARQLSQAVNQGAISQDGPSWPEMRSLAARASRGLSGRWARQARLILGVLVLACTSGCRLHYADGWRFSPNYTLKWHDRSLYLVKKSEEDWQRERERAQAQAVRDRQVKREQATVESLREKGYGFGL